MLGPTFNGPSGFSRGILSVLSIDDGDGDNIILLNPKEIDGRLEIGGGEEGRHSTRLMIMTWSPISMSAAVVAALVLLIGKPAGTLLGMLLVSIALKCETWSLSGFVVVFVLI